MLYPACSRVLFESAGLYDHPSCRDNLLIALARAGVTLPFVPDPVDFFQNSPSRADGGLELLPPTNPPGGFVVLRAECDLLLVITACSTDHDSTNAWVCTEIGVEISPGH
ncbi:MAG: DUF1989 domain-containing protein [Alphaproteobacteria bacterium]|jgi:uncharacterized protein|nr:DUF1989 domain-containing protein [Alphaproteobacteria bacterium]